MSAQPSYNLRVKRVTLEIDDETDRLARAAAKAAGVPYALWLRERLVPALQKQLSGEWPPEVRKLVGCAPDFPLRDPPFQ